MMVKILGFSIVGRQYMGFYKKFRLVHPDGTMNTDGPGYEVDKKGNVSITKPTIYSKNAQHILAKQKRKNIVHRHQLEALLFTMGTFGLFD